MKIPFNRPCKTGKSMAYIGQVVESGKTGADGVYTNLCGHLLEDRLGANRILMTTSCTHGMELALSLIALEPGDEVIMPSYTFPSTANSVLLHQGKVVFTEVNHHDLCIDTHLIEAKITPRTRAIMVVHYGGNACHMDDVMNIARKHGLYVIEDAAQGLYSTYKGQQLGTIGHFGCYSFHETKNISAGEGGALAINTLDPMVMKRASYIRQKGTNRLDYTLGEVDYYEWVDCGSSYCPSEILMAYLYGQLEQADDIHEKRLAIFHGYKALLDDIQSHKIAYYAKGNEYGAFNGHIFYMIFHEAEDAKFFIENMKEMGIDVYTHFVPLHMSKMGYQLGYVKDDFAYESGLCNRLVRLPLYSQMSDKERIYIEKGIRETLAILQGRGGDYHDDINRYSCI